MKVTSISGSSRSVNGPYSSGVGLLDDELEEVLLELEDDVDTLEEELEDSLLLELNDEKLEEEETTLLLLEEVLLEEVLLERE